MSKKTYHVHYTLQISDVEEGDVEEGYEERVFKAMSEAMTHVRARILRGELLKKPKPGAIRTTGKLRAAGK